MREQPLSLTPNGEGAQCYFRQEFLEDDRANVGPGDQLRAIHVEAGILLVPQSSRREYRVEARHRASDPHPQTGTNGDPQ